MWRNYGWTVTFVCAHLTGGKTVATRGSTEMPVIPRSPGPINVELNARESHSDHDRSERWHDYSVEFGEEGGPIASLPQGACPGFGPSFVYGHAGWSWHGLSKG